MIKATYIVRINDLVDDVNAKKPGAIAKYKALAMVGYLRGYDNADLYKRRCSWADGPRNQLKETPHDPDRT